MTESDRDLAGSLNRIRRWRRLYWTLLVAFLIGFAFMFRVPTAWAVAVPIMYLVVGGGAIACADLLMRQLECPRCHGPFFRQVQQAFSIRANRWAYWTRRCANCGLLL